MLPSDIALTDFPHIAQAFRVTRHTALLSGGEVTKERHEIVHGITSLSHTQASARDLFTYVRAHWAIEAMHHVRDVTFQEDHSQSKTHAGPQVFATLRNTCMTILRAHGCENIAAGRRGAGWGGRRAVLQMIGAA